MLIDIFHDTVCPWCRIGKKHLFDALAQWQSEPVSIRWHPFLLDDSVPAEGYEFRSFMQKRKGLSPQQIQQLFDFAKRAGEAAGVKLDFNNIPLAVNTKLSHRLIELAPENIKINVVEAVYKAYFEDGLNLGNIDVIVDLGTAAGMNASELRQQLSDDAALNAIAAESISAKFNGITSVPFFILINTVTVEGSHSVEVFIEALNRAALIEVSAKQC
jgi:predicted DsbA family dithiol-disulfide isomerase